jgi:hypothetical protein
MRGRRGHFNVQMGLGMRWMAPFAGLAATTRRAATLQ